MYGKQPGNLKLNNLTYGFGVRLLHYGFDFGHTLGDKDNIISRAGTNYFSIVITFNN